MVKNWQLPTKYWGKKILSGFENATIVDMDQSQKNTVFFSVLTDFYLDASEIW